MKRWLFLIFILFFPFLAFSESGWQGDSAADLKTDTTYFNKNLSIVDDNVQKALDTLDDITTGGSISDAVYGATWDTITTIAPSKNAVYDKIESLAGGHAVVTLDANADDILKLTTQEVGLQTQTANTVFAGRVNAGTALVPTFRSLVVLDIPDLSATYLPLHSKADTAGTADTATANSTKALDNLVSVAINTSLISDIAATDDLGTEALYWKKLYLGSDISFEGATDDAYQTTLTAVDPTLSDKSINIPNASGTMAVSATAPITLSALGDIGVTVLKDLVTTAPLTGGTNDILVGADADITLALTTGIADTNAVVVNAADVADNDYAKFTATGLEGRSYSEVLSDIGAQATDTDLTTWAGITPAANVGTFLATPSSANLLAAVTDETGSASGTPLLVFNQAPVLITPAFDHFAEATGAHKIIHDNTLAGVTTQTDHLGEYNSAHTIVLDNDMSRVGKISLDHLAEATGAHTIVADNTITSLGILPAADSTSDLGSSAPKYFANAYLDKIYLNSTATLDGTAAGTVAVTGNIKVDQIIETTAAHGIDIDGWHIKDGGASIATGGTNTFNLTNGTASLDVAAGAAVDVNANLTVETASTVNQDLTSDASPTFNQGNFTTTHTTTALADHIGEHTGAHTVTFDNTITNAGQSDLTTVHSTTELVDHIGEHTASHKVVFDNIVSTTSNIQSMPHQLRFTIIDPPGAYAKSTIIPLWVKTDAALTITNIEFRCDADPATEPTLDLKVADDLIGLGNAAVLHVLDTTAGTFSSGAETIAVAAGKTIYLSYDTAPLVSTLHSGTITYDYD